MTQADEFDGPEILRDNVPYLTHRISMLMYETVDPYLKKQDISLEMCRVLFMLSEVGPHNLVALSEATSVKTSTLSRLVGRMVQRGLVSRSRSDTDNRTVNVAILPPGQKMIDRLMPRMSEVWQIPQQGFSPEELPILTSYLRRLLCTVANYGATTDK